MLVITVLLPIAAIIMTEMKLIKSLIIKKHYFRLGLIFSGDILFFCSIVFIYKGMRASAKARGAWETFFVEEIMTYLYIAIMSSIVILISLIRNLMIKRYYVRMGLVAIATLVLTSYEIFMIYRYIDIL